MAASAKQLPSGNWRVRATDPKTGKTRSFTSTNSSKRAKREVEAEAAAWLLEVHDLYENPRFRQAAEDYIAAKEPVLSPTTIHGYRVMLRNNMDRLLDVPLRDITSRLVQEWVNELTVAKSAKTVHNVYGFFTAVMNYHEISISLKRVTLPPKTRHFKTLPEPQTIMNIFRGTEIELPVLLGLWCGMRMSEILGVRRQDIAGDVLTINQVIVTVKGEHITKNTAKTHDSKRQLRLPPQITALIPPDLAPDDLIVTMTRNQIYEKYIWALGKHGIKITFHDLRHINASVMAALNIPDLYAMERGGWSNTTTLRQVYQQTFTAERDKVDKQIDDYFSGLYAANNCHEIDTKNEKINNNAV